MGRSRYSGPWPRRPIQWRGQPAETPCPLPDSNLCQGLAGRQDFTARIPGSALHGAATASASAVLQCTLFVSSRNPSEQGRGLVFLCRSNRAITCRFSLLHLQLFNDRASGSRALRFTLCRIISRQHARGRSVTAGDCAVLQPGNGEAEAPGVGRWVLRSHNDTMAFSLSKTLLPMILGPSWNSELNLCNP
jgi:hypothetical protein